MAPDRISTHLYGPMEIDQALEDMAKEILARFDQEPVVIGIRRGGVIIAERLKTLMAADLGHPPASGVIDINLYRDDWTLARALPKVGKTELSFSLDNRRVVLVDDVLFTGRTVRAALEALVDFGRPSRIELAVLVDRGLREMPIEANYLGFRVETTPAERVNVNFAAQNAGRDEVVLETAA